MRRIAASAILGGFAGALSAFSHGVAGGAVGLIPLSIIVAISALIFAVLPRRLRGVSGTIAVLIGIQLLAHLWLEAVHPHHPAIAGGHMSSHGLAGAIAHALTPAMVMMWAHLFAVVAGGVLILALRPLMETLLEAVTSWLSPRRARSGVPALSLPSSWSSPRNGRPLLLTHIIEGRGPPAFA